MSQVFILYGNDIPVLYQNLDQIESKLKQENPSIQFQSFGETTWTEINNFLDSGSLFGDTFCLKIKKIKGLNSLEAWKDNHHFLILQSEEDKDPLPKENSSWVTKIPCVLPKSWDLLKLIQKKLGSSIQSSVAEYLSHTLNSVLEIEEIKKQMLFYNISVLDLESLSIVYPEEDFSSFTLAEYFFEPKHINLFLQGLNNLINRGTSLDTLLNALLKKTKDFIAIKKGLLEQKNIQTIAQEIKLHPFITEKMVPIVKLYTPRMLKDLIVKIVETQFLSRFYSSELDSILLTRLFLEQKEASCLR